MKARVSHIIFFFLWLWSYNANAQAPISDSLLDDNTESYTVETVIDTSNVEAYKDLPAAPEAEEQDKLLDHEDALYTGEEQSDKQLFEKRKLDDQKWKALSSDKIFNYKHKAEKRIKLKAEKAEKKSNWENVLIVVVVLLILGFIIYILLGKYYFSKSDRQLTVESSQEDNEDLHEKDYSKEIRAALNKNNLRLAFRLRFMQVLQKLNNKELINYHKDKTNYDYLNELGRNDLKSKFRQMVYYFDYIWYGMYEINLEQYNNTEQLALQVLEKLDHI